MRSHGADDLAATHVLETTRPWHHRKILSAMHDDDSAARRLDVLTDTALDPLPRSDRLIWRPHPRRRLLTNALQLALTQACKGRPAHLEGTVGAQAPQVLRGQPIAALGNGAGQL